MSPHRRDAALCGLIALLAAALRLPGLGVAPLTASEASSAWIAWLQAGGDGAADATRLPWSEASPFLMSCQWLLFSLGGSGETVARLPAAACGIVLALVPLLLRSALGTVASVSLAVLLAADPVSIACARHADGAVASGLFACFTLASLWRWLGPPAPATHAGLWGWATAAGAGLLLVTGRHAWDLPPIVLAFLLLQHDARGAMARLASPPLRRAFLGAALLGATGFLGVPELAGSVSASLTAWLRQWSETPRVPSLRDLLALVRSSPLLWMLALVGLQRCWRRHRRAALFLSLWALWGLMLFSLGARERSSPLLLTLALTVAAALGVAWLREWIQASPLSGLSGPRAIRVGVLVILGALLALNLRRTSEAVAGVTSRSSATETTGRDVRRLVEDVERLASERTGDAHDLPVVVVGSAWPDPVLGWTLRRMRHVRFAPAPAGEREHGAKPLLISSGEAVDLDLSADHLGARYVIRRRTSGSSAAQESEIVILWVPR